MLVLVLLLVVQVPSVARADDPGGPDRDRNSAGDSDGADRPRSLDDELRELDRQDAIGRGNAARALGFPASDDFDEVFADLDAPANPRIIDIERMHARDCRHDRRLGGHCVLRGLDDEPNLGIDVSGYGDTRAQQARFEVLERVLDSLDQVAR